MFILQNPEESPPQVGRLCVCVSFFSVRLHNFLTAIFRTFITRCEVLWFPCSEISIFYAELFGGVLT